MPWDGAGHALSWVALVDPSGAGGGPPTELLIEGWERVPVCPYFFFFITLTPRVE